MSYLGAMEFGMGAGMMDMGLMEM